MISDNQLFEKALDFALSNSYSPYSNIKVGAAALLSNGNVVCGANLENSSSPVSICAEQSMLCTINNHCNGVAVIAVAVAAIKEDKQFPITPCGMCRQMLLECEMRQGQNIRIIFNHDSNLKSINSARELLPYAFSL
ncbi:MAG: cytidine deaminase [Rikenellaceae bacterium]